MRTLFLTSSGLNEKTMVLFWKCIGKEPINTKAILVPSAAVGNDGAREGIIVCMERLMNMGIPMNNIYPIILRFYFPMDIKEHIQVILVTYLYRFA